VPKAAEAAAPAPPAEAAAPARAGEDSSMRNNQSLQIKKVQVRKTLAHKEGNSIIPFAIDFLIEN